MSCQSNFKQKELSVCFQIDTLLRGDAPKPVLLLQNLFSKGNNVDFYYFYFPHDVTKICINTLLFLCKDFFFFLTLSL